MRDSGSIDSSIRFPLDLALGSVAQVRLLRVLLMHGSSPLSVSDAARLTGLTAAGARRALDRLRVAGFVSRVGSGHTPTYAVRAEAAGMSALAQAFRDEEARYVDIIDMIRDAVSIPEAHAAWIERMPGDPSEPVHVSVVADAASVSWIPGELRSRLLGLERTFDIIVELAILTRADDPVMPPDAMMLWGMTPESLTTKRPTVKTHRAASERGLAMSREIASLIRRDASLVDRATRYVTRLLKDEQGMATSDLLEWLQLLEHYSPDRIADLLGSESSRAERLRQSSPFFAILSPAERDAVLDRLEVPSE